MLTLMQTRRPVPHARPRVETLGYDWEEVVSALRCCCKRTEVRGFKEGEVYDQMYRGSASRGDFSPLFCPCPYGGTPLFPNHGPGLQSWEACVSAEEKRCGLYFLTFFYFWYLVVL